MRHLPAAVGMNRNAITPGQNVGVQQLGSAAALLLAATFAWAAASKLVAPARTTASFTALGLPAPGLLARTVPLVELIATVLLIVSPSVGGAAALGLLGVFTVFVVVALRSGRTAGCGCFGAAAASDDGLSWVEPLRNSLLAGLAALALTAPGLVAPGLSAVMTIGSLTAAGAMVLGLARLRQRVGAVWATPLPGSFPIR